MGSHTRIWITGDCEGLDALAAELDAAGLAVVRAAGSAGELAKRIAASHPQVVVHGGRGRGVASELATLREHVRVPVVLATTERTGAVVEAAAAAGAADVLLLPQPVEAVLFALRKLTRAEAVERPAGRVVTVFSPKGGTGKSVTASNVAVALAKLHGRRTLLVDLDLQFGDAAIMLGLEPYKTLHDLVLAGGDLDAEKLAGYATEHPSGLHVLPAPLRPEDAELVKDDDVAYLLESAAAAYDFVVVDTAPFLHGTVLTALDRTDELLLVCTPDVPTMKNVRLTLQTLELLGFPEERIRMLLNRTSAQVGLSARDVAAALERRIDFELASDPAVPLGVNRGNPAVVSARKSAYSRALVAMVAQLAGASAGAEEKPAQARRRRRFAVGTAAA